MTTIDTTANKVKEAVNRLAAASKAGLPLHIRLQLIEQVMVAQCENNIAISEAVVNLIRDVMANSKDLKRKVAAIIDGAHE